jgi:hypothetical protein
MVCASDETPAVGITTPREITKMINGSMRCNPGSDTQADRKTGHNECLSLTVPSVIG